MSAAGQDGLARAELWRAAQSVSAAAGAGLSERARRIAVQDDAPITLQDLRAAPDWSLAEPAARARLARLAGAAGSVHAWRRSIDGAILRRAAEAVGEPALDALLALPEVMTPAVPDAAAGRGDGEALARLGGALLLAGGDCPRALQPRLRRGLGAGRAPGLDADAAATLRRTAEALVAQSAAGQSGTGA